MTTIEFIVYCLSLVSFTTIGLIISALLVNYKNSKKTDKKDR